MHPCFPPDLIINQSDVTLPSTTVRSKPTYMPSITLTILSGISELLMIFDNLSLCTESKAFSKSTTKCAYRPALDSFACPKMFLSIKICSAVFLLGQNPACSFRSFLSMPFLIRSHRILQDILLMRGSKVTPLQLLHSCKLPFLNTLTTSLFFHTFHHLSVSQSLL